MIKNYNRKSLTKGGKMACKPKAAAKGKTKAAPKKKTAKKK
jgi:hypothetical protein